MGPHPYNPQGQTLHALFASAGCELQDAECGRGPGALQKPSCSGKAPDCTGQESCCHGRPRPLLEVTLSPPKWLRVFQPRDQERDTSRSNRAAQGSMHRSEAAGQRENNELCAFLASPGVPNKNFSMSQKWSSMLFTILQ